MDVLLAIAFGYMLLRFVLPGISAFTEICKDEMRRIHREGLIKTDGAFWSPDQELKTKHH